MKNIKVIAEEIYKEADTVQNLGRILNLHFDNKLVEQGSKLLRILDKLDIESKDFVTKIDLENIKNKIRSSMQNVQEVWEDLFALQQRLINEGE